MRRFLLSILACGVATGWSMPASAQLRHPRCGGYPPAQGQRGLVIGGVGSTCYGALVAQVRGRVALVGARVARPPAHGTFELLNDREFAYTPGRGMTAEDSVVVVLDRSRDGRVTPVRMVLRVTNEDLYRAAGGSESGPPPDTLVGRATHGGRGSRGGGRF